ncbi:MAG: YcjF family protein [Gemmataceae bacterium]
MLGRTQSGKTTIIRYLTGATEAEIGQGFKPCTRFSREFDFPTSEAPLLRFLDTRGLDEPGYDAKEDLARFNEQAHVVMLTVKVMDHGQETLLNLLPTIRRAAPQRLIVLVLTCLHEAYPQEQHAEPYPFSASGPKGEIPESLSRCVEEQRRRFDGLVDAVVPIDLTPSAEGFAEHDYGGEYLKKTLIEALPAAYRQTLLSLQEANEELKDVFAKQALPHILGYSTLAATAGAIPIPWLDLFILPGIQTRMIFHLANLYGQPLTAKRFLELAGTLGLGIALRQATRELAKLIPVVGSVAGSVLGGASTFALGKAFCFYFEAVHQGHVPTSEELRHYYRDQLALAEGFWKEKSKK